MSVYRIRMIATVMLHVWTLLEAIPASAILGSREMEKTVQVSMYHPVVNAQLVELKIFTESFTGSLCISLMCKALFSTLFWSNGEFDGDEGAAQSFLCCKLTV